MNQEVQRAARRAQAYWMIDGLPHIFLGIGFLCVALVLALPFLLSPIVSEGSALILPLVLAIVILAGRPLLEHIKEQVTYPRSGYVAYTPLPGYLKILSLLAGLALSVIAVLAFTKLPASSRYILPLIQGCAVALLYVLAALRCGDARHLYGFALLSILLSIVSIQLWSNLDYSSIFYYSAMGLISLASGFIIFKHYLKAHASEEDYE